MTVVIAADFGAAVDDANRVRGTDFGPFRAGRFVGNVHGETVPIIADCVSDLEGPGQAALLPAPRNPTVQAILVLHHVEANRYAG